MTQLELDEKITLEFCNILRTHFPKQFITSFGSSGHSYHASLSDKNHDFKDSSYYYNRELKFVHWTSVNNLLSIINNREIRLYNLFNSSDPDEFYYAASALNISHNQIDHSKNYYFTFSFCRSDDLDNKYLWNEYGKDYSGVAIEFEIINKPDLWEKFMISQVYYKLPQFLNNFIFDLGLLCEKYPGIETKIDLGKLIGFHKEKALIKENEVRLSTYFPYDSYESYRKYCNCEFRFDKDRPRITSYFGLSLWVDNDSTYVKSDNPKYDNQLKIEKNYFTIRPQIKLTQIHFGKNCGITNYQFSEFRKKLEEIIKIKLGYRLELERKLFK